MTTQRRYKVPASLLGVYRSMTIDEPVTDLDSDGFRASPTVKKRIFAELKRRNKEQNKRNPGGMKRPKLGQWVKAHRVRLVKRNGATHVEIQRTVAKKRKATKKR